MHELKHESALSTDKTWPQILIENLTSVNEVNEDFLSAMYRICAYIAASKGLLCLYTYLQASSNKRPV